MPRPTSPTPLTRAICDGARAIYAEHGPVLHGEHGAPEMPDVPDDDAGLLTVQRLFEKYRGEGLLPDFSDPPTQTEIQHTASIWLWRERYGIERRGVETLPLWLRVHGYPIMDAVLVSCMVRSLFEEVPEKIQLGTQEQKSDWASKQVEEAGARETSKKRADPARTRLVRILADDFFLADWQQHDDTLLVEATSPRNLKARREVEERRIQSSSKQAAADTVDAALYERYMLLAGGDCDTSNLGTLLSVHVTQRPTIDDNAATSAILPHSTPEDEDDTLTTTADLEAAMVPYPTLVAMLRTGPPIIRILNDTRRGYDDYNLNHRANPELPGITKPSQHSWLLRQFFIDACSAVCLEMRGPGRVIG